tara:strand:+ start:953 stop:1804 length:852 start_codon:yes stop_codon:yes gene_type:complete
MYLLSYFRTESEALHLALSEDGFTFEAVNGNLAVLEATEQTGTMRDPFLFQDQDGLFHLLATDGWRGTSLAHATSEDLIFWSEQRIIPVMETIPGTRNVWAPEVFYGIEDGQYRIIWSSTVDTSETERVRDHRIWACNTIDFETFSDSYLFFDPGYNVIDATVVGYGDVYLMAFKDERGENRVDTDYKAIRTAISLVPGGPFEAVSDLVTPAPVEGPTIYRKDNLWVMLYDHFLEDCYGVSVSKDGRQWTVSEVEVVLPEGLRHGSVIEVSKQIADRLKSHFG